MSNVIKHIAIKVDDLEGATKFYEQVFGFRQLKTGSRDGHISRHMTDGYIDFAIMKYESEETPEATLAGEDARIHHWGIEVDDRAAFADKIRAAGGEILSKPDANALKFRAPDGTIAEIVVRGAFKTAPKA
jgi:lactoylglutathione lyase